MKKPNIKENPDFSEVIELIEEYVEYATNPNKGPFAYTHQSLSVFWKVLDALYDKEEIKAYLYWAWDERNKRFDDEYK